MDQKVSIEEKGTLLAKYDMRNNEKVSRVCRRKSIK